jgi:pyruvate/2-oxoglutarate dehydrogenase complex dihydrolipoamide acyltransferase (E2) component
MNKPCDKNGFEKRRFPDSRVSTVDIGILGKKRHHMKALLEVDVTKARERIARISGKTGVSLSFTAWLVKCISLAVGEYPELHAFMNNRQSVLIFDDIDICITVEKEHQGMKVPLPYVIRSTNTKSLLDIHEEIRQAMENKPGDGSVVIGQDYDSFATRFFLGLPGPLRRLFWKVVLLKPFTAKKNMGSIMLTSVGMYSSFDGWVIPTSIHPLCFAIGNIVEKPGVWEGEITIRQYLKITALVDHDVVDGVPAARFISRLDQLLQNACGLGDWDIQ